MSDTSEKSWKAGIEEHYISNPNKPENYEIIK
jgi:hypothetical protein